MERLTYQLPRLLSVLLILACLLLPVAASAARCLGVHLVGVPLGMAVLLLPARPYPGLEGQVYTTRVYDLEQLVIKKALQDYLSEHQAVPPVHSYRELLQLLKPGLGRFAGDPDLWAAAYLFYYHRLDTSEKQRHSIEWNSSAAGIKLSDMTESSLWLIRSDFYGFCEGLVIDSEGRVKRMTGRKALGYDDAPKAKIGIKNDRSSS